MAKTNANANFDPTTMFTPFQMPGVDVETLVAAQRRNIEAVTAANQLAVDGVKAIAERQAEFVRGAVDQYVAAIRDLMSVTDPKTGAAKQAELVKSTFETSVANMRELADIATKANVEAIEVLNKRVVEGLDEISGLAKKT